VVPAAPIAPVTGVGCNCSTVPGAVVPRPRYQPTLANQPLTFAVQYDDTAAASTFLEPSQVPQPRIKLSSDDGVTWIPTEDLLEENDTFSGFIPEIEWDGTAHLRFGDGTYGAAPDAGLAFTANYRTGNGTAGNLGRTLWRTSCSVGPALAACAILSRRLAAWTRRLRCTYSNMRRSA